MTTKRTTHGGKRTGAGAPRKPRALKKEQMNVKLPGWLRDWMAGQQKSRAILIEDAMAAYYSISALDGEQKR